MIHAIYIYLIIGAFIGGNCNAIVLGGWCGFKVAAFCFVAWPIFLAQGFFYNRRHK